MPDLETAPHPPPPDTVVHEETREAQNVEADNSNETNEIAAASNVPDTVTSKSEDPDEGTEMKTDANPDLIVYYKMIKFGIPLAAVRIKMRAEGFDPGLLKV